MAIDVYPRLGTTYPDAVGDPITSVGATVDESPYINNALDAGYLLTTDPLLVFQPVDRTDPTGGASAPVGGSYIVTEANTTLTHERVLTAGANISIVDGGPGGALTITGTGSGDVAGPASATDERLARFDGGTGKLIQTSAIAVTDAGAMTGLTGLTVTGSITVSGAVDGRDVSTDGATLDALGTEVDGLAAPSYVTLANTATLANERALAATAPITLTDGGAGGSVTLAAPTVVVGPVSANDERLARFDGGTGKLIQSSPVGLTDAGAMTGLTGLTVTGNITVSGTVDGRDVSADGATLDALGTEVDGLAVPSYLTLGATGTLTNERVLTAGTNISFVDGGAGSTLTINGASTGAPTTAQYLTLAADGTLTNERVLTAGAGMAFVDAGAGSTLTLNNVQVVNNIAAGSYTTVLSDAGKLIVTAGSSPVVITVISGYPAGTKLAVYQNGAGQVSIVGDVGVSIRSAAGGTIYSKGQQSIIHLEYVGGGGGFWNVEGDYAPVERIQAQAGPTFTPAITDLAAPWITFSGATAITIPHTSTASFPLGTVFDFEQVGTGQVTVAPAGSVTLNTPSGFTAATRNQWAKVRVIHRTANVWDISGELQDNTSYVTLGTTAAYPNERVLTAGSNITLTDGGAGSTLTISATGTSVVLNNQVGTTYTFVLADAGKLVTGNNASAITFTIPANASVAFPIGTVIQVAQLGAGQITIVITTDTLNNSGYSNTTRARYSMVSLTKITSTSWIASGDMGF